MNEQETTEDIIAEMCAREDLDGGDMVDNFDIYIGEYGGWDALKLIKAYADRLEAAHKRERGDCAKLREALKDIVRIVEQIRLLYSDYPYETHLIARKAKAALAAPPRNCDVGTAMEQGERFAAYCRAHKHPESEYLPCPLLFGQTGGYCELAWAQMPYEEGGAK